MFIQSSVELRTVLTLVNIICGIPKIQCSLPGRAQLSTIALVSIQAEVAFYSRLF